MTIKKIVTLLLLAALTAPVGDTGPALADQMETDMNVARVELVAQPMIYVTATARMTEIPEYMGRAFGTLGQFFGASGVAPLGPPMAVYHDWSGDRTVIDVGFPVSKADAQKASGDVLAGMTPGGHALKVVHIGAYDDFPATYAAIFAAMKDADIPDSSRMWEVYLTEPGTTPATELVTEIYVQVSAEDAAKFAPSSRPQAR